MKRSVAALCLLAAVTSTAEEFVAQARVVDATPIYATLEVDSAPRCTPTKPDPSEGLVATLRWDLCAEARHGPRRPQEYRVRYEWDGRIYERVMSRHPGNSVPVRIRLD